MNHRIANNPGFRRAVAFVPATMLVVFAGTSFVFYSTVRHNREAVGRTREAMLAAEAVISDLKDAETSQRGFLMFGEESFLQPYQAARAKLAVDTMQLHQSASPSQSEHLAQMHQHIALRLAIIDSTIALKRAGKTEAAYGVVRAGAGLREMASIRRIASQMGAEQQDSLQSQLAQEHKSALVLGWLLALGSLLIIVTAGVVNRALVLFGEESQRNAEQLAQQNAELEAQRDQLQEQAIELESQQQELELQMEELNTANDELIVARDEAEKANEAKSTFLSSMSHELRTPLNAIAGYTDLIESGVYGPLTDRQLDATRRIHANEVHLLTIINQILNYTGLRAGGATPMLTAVNALALSEQLDAIIRPQIDARGLTYALDYPDDGAPWVLAHQDRLRQVLINLLINAVKFTPAPGSVVLACSSADNQVRFEVRDTGIGIPADKLDHIFEPFVQLNRNAPDSKGAFGVGLGLAISRELVESMGGEITVSSVLGQGTTFTVVLAGTPAPVATAPLNLQGSSANPA